MNQFPFVRLHPFPTKKLHLKKTCVFDDERHPLFFAFQDSPFFVVVSLLVFFSG